MDVTTLRVTKLEAVRSVPPVVFVTLEDQWVVPVTAEAARGLSLGSRVSLTVSLAREDASVRVGV